MLLNFSAPLPRTQQPNEAIRAELWLRQLANLQPALQIREVRGCQSLPLSMARVRILSPVEVTPQPCLVVRFPTGSDSPELHQVFLPFTSFRMNPAADAGYLSIGGQEVQALHASPSWHSVQKRAETPDFRDAVACLWDFLSLPRRMSQPFCSVAATVVLGQLFADSPPSLPRQPLAPRVLARVLAWMREHVQDRVKLADLAQQAQVSQFHFARLFKAATNESPHAFLVRLRIECARELLASDRQLTTATVAQACGFSDQGHLSRQFRKITGYSPAQYRRHASRSLLREPKGKPLFAS